MEFKFKAKNLTGQSIEGTREAFDRQALALALRNEGYIVTSLAEVNQTESGLLQRWGLTIGRVSLREKIMFAQNLAAMLEAGLALARSLSVFERQTRNKFLKKSIAKIIAKVNAGKSLSMALLEQPAVFPSVFAAMVAAGEESGTLPGSLKLIGEQLDKSYELKRKIRGAMIYPAIIIVVIILIGILMMIFVVPALTATFQELKLDLPLSTRAIIGLSNFFVNYYLIVIVVTLASVVGFSFWRKTKVSKIMISRLALKLPVIGVMVQELNSALVMRNLSALISAGVSLTESLKITSSVVNNTEYQNLLLGSIEAIEKGVLVSQVFKAREDLFPPLVGEMAEVGEETGELAAMLLRGAIFFEGEVDNKTKNLSTIVEPVLLVLIGCAVGFFAISMIGPMYSLTEAL
ncbi:MAG: type II secretion system F family protein [Candidatus Vogelbacteria bacterium]|nr:type II secretion system F family protein [Candidatus Vogelbacteria bacterium]